MSLPMSYDVINIVASTYTPTSIHAKENGRYQMFCRYLWQKAISVFKWEIPDNWDLDYLLYTLYGFGFTAVIDTPRYGVIHQFATIEGLNVYYNPLNMLISNPLLPTLQGKPLLIGKDCALVKLTPDYCGIGDIIGYYAEQMALASSAISVNLINSKLANVFACKDKNQAQSFKKMTDEILSGAPASFVDKSLFDEAGNPQWQQFINNLSQNYIVSDILQDINKLEDNFNTLIGIPNSNTEKKERQNVDEINANNVETKNLAETWLDNLHTTFDIVKEMYGVSVKVDWRTKPVEIAPQNTRRKEQENEQ